MEGRKSPSAADDPVELIHGSETEEPRPLELACIGEKTVGTGNLQKFHEQRGMHFMIGRHNAAIHAECRDESPGNGQAFQFPESGLAQEGIHSCVVRPPQCDQDVMRGELVKILYDHDRIGDDGQIGIARFQQTFGQEENGGGGIEENNVSIGDFLFRHLGDFLFLFPVAVDAVLEGGGKDRHSVSRIAFLGIRHSAMEMTDPVPGGEPGNVPVNGRLGNAEMLHEFGNAAVFFLFQIVQDGKSAQIFQDLVSLRSGRIGFVRVSETWRQTAGSSSGPSVHRSIL